MDRELIDSLPSREIFPIAMPRYPNLWFCISEKLALRGEYSYALRFLERVLDLELGLRDSFNAEVANPNLRTMLGAPGEGADFQARIGLLQYYSDPAAPRLSHWHQLHARFYVRDLMRTGAFRFAGAPAAAGSAAGGSYLLVPASVHFEVATEEESHPYVDACPDCGITGSYAVPIDRATQDYCLKIHDPLGLELLLYGTVRGRPVSNAASKHVASLSALRARYGIAFEEHRPGPDGCEMLAAVYFNSDGRVREHTV